MENYYQLINTTHNNIKYHPVNRYSKLLLILHHQEQLIPNVYDIITIKYLPV